MKRKLLLMTVALLCSVGSWADEDYTSQMSTTLSKWSGVDERKNYDGGVEVYHGNTNAFSTGDVLYQTISGLPNGFYKVSFYAWENFAKWGSATGPAYGDNIAQVFANTSTKDLKVIQSYESETGRGWNEANTYTLLAKVTNGSLKYGVKNIASGGNWAVCKPISLTYLGATLGSTDLTFYICNHSFEDVLTTGWTNTGDMARQDNSSFEKTGNYYAEYWQPNGTKGVSQTLSGLPAGRYSLSADCKARGVTSAKVFAKTYETAITIGDTKATYTVDFDCDGNTKFNIGFQGVGTGTRDSWIAVDNFTLSYKPYISVIADEYPSTSSLAADKWYVYTIPMTGDYYFSATEGVVYTTNGSQVYDNVTTSAASSKVSFTKDDKVYVRSTTDQAVKIEGIFYLSTTVGGKTKWLSRMTDNNASVDDFGLAFKFTTDDSGISYFQFLENEAFYLDDNNSYNVATKTKRGANTNKWVLESVTGGYKIKLQVNQACKLYVANTTTGLVKITNNTDTEYIWNFVTPTEHDTQMQAWVDAQANTAATAGSRSASTRSALEAILTNDQIYGTQDMTSKIDDNPTEVADNFKKGGQLFTEQTISELPNGFYRLRYYGFQRISSNVITYAASLKNAHVGVAYVYANGQKTRLMSVMDVASDTQWNGSDDYSGSNGKYYPNGTTGAKNAFDAGEYANDVYVYVSDGNLTFGVYNPSNPECDNWAPGYKFELTYYSADAVAADYDALNTAISTADAGAHTLGFETGEYAPYRNVDMLTALAMANAIDQESTNTKESVYEAISALTGATWTANVAEVNAFCDGSFADTYSHEGNVQPKGWTGGTRHDNATDVRYMWDVSANPGLAATSNSTALFTKYDAYYGKAGNYTMPLKENTIYKLTFKYGTWGTGDDQTRGDGYIQIKDASDNTITIDPSNSLAIANDERGANGNTAKWKNFTGYFFTADAGNYVLELLKTTTRQQNQYAYSDFNLVRATAEEIKLYLNAEITTANGVYSGANIGEGVFQIPASAGETFNTAIETAQGVYEKDNATVDELTNAISALEDAINTFNAAELNAPTPDQAYIIRNTTADGALNIANESVTIGTDAAVYFTAVEGGYALSNADGLYILKTTNNNWTLSTTETEDEAYVLTFAHVDGGYTISGIKGLFGTDATAAGSTVYANKAQANNGVWTITEATTVNMNVKAGKWGTFIAPFDVTIPANVTAYNATGVNGERITLSDAIETTIPANTPVLLKNDGDAVDNTLYGVSTANADSYTVGLLTGVYTAATIPAGASNYVLQTHDDGVQAFYKVDADFTATPYKCYLTIPAATSPVKAFLFPENPTAINAIETAENENTEIYNLAGQRLSKVQKGVNIINGKKVLVK